ncbi:MAG: hypothetical protein JRG71_02060 [Deltaproteobacteria bacterium]|nr:hypothetical protein [Deltaproteobacteria bacterium]
MAQHRTLNLLAAIIWYGGSIILLLKSADLVCAAQQIRPAEYCHLLIPSFGFPIGVLKGYTFFSRACNKNLNRIAMLTNPKPWQCYRPRFLFFLTLMIAFGATLSRVSQNNYWLLCAVAALDISLSTALLTSGRMFWKRKVISQEPSQKSN